MTNAIAAVSMAGGEPTARKARTHQQVMNCDVKYTTGGCTGATFAASELALLQLNILITMSIMRVSCTFIYASKLYNYILLVNILLLCGNVHLNVIDLTKSNRPCMTSFCAGRSR